MEKEIRISGGETQSAQPTGSWVLWGGPARGKESGTGGKGGMGHSPRGPGCVVDTVMVVGRPPLRLLGLHSRSRSNQSPSEGIHWTQSKRCAHAPLPRGGGKSILLRGFHGGRQGPNPVASAPKRERSLDAERHSGPMSTPGERRSRPREVGQAGSLGSGTECRGPHGRGGVRVGGAHRPAQFPRPSS